MAEYEKPAATPKEIVTEAHERFARAQEFYSKSRKLAIEDTKFVMGDSDNHWQWPAEYFDERSSAKRVCLTVNTTSQHCNQIINAIRQNKPTGKVSPVDSGGDKRTAEMLAGLVRNIQSASSADDAHDVGAEHAVYGGEGYWRIITEYETPTSHRQVIKVKACPNPQQVYIDPNTKELDRSDARWGFVFEDIPIEQGKREHPEIDPKSWGDDLKGNAWVGEDTFRRAEYFYCTYEKDTACLLADGTGVLKSALPEGALVVKERPTEITKWHWCKLVGGHDKPVMERDWLGEFLPIISVVGREVNVDGEMVRKGQVRDLKDPARMVNYAYSETVQTLALQNKIPYLAAAEAIEGHEAEWKSANTSTDAVLLFNAFDSTGNQLPAPKRQEPAVMPAAQIQLLHLSTEQMRASSGQTNSNFGIKSEAASGIGIERLKVQGEIATFHFPDNLARALRYEMRVIINLIQKYYDTSQIVRILGVDGKEEHARLDPGAKVPYSEQMGVNGEIQKIFNPLLGRYDVAIDTGPSFMTQRQEGAVRLNELAGKNPQLMAMAGDLIMEAQDFPGAEKLAQRLEKTLPPELRDGGPPALPPQVREQMQAMQQHIAELTQALKEAESGVQATMAKVHVQSQADQAKHEARLQEISQEGVLKHQMQENEIELARRKALAEHQLREDQAVSDAGFEKWSAELKARTAIEVAEISKGAQISVAQIQAASQAVQAQTAAANKATTEV